MVSVNLVPRPSLLFLDDKGGKGERAWGPGWVKRVTTQTEDGKPVLCSLELELKERVQIWPTPRESISSVNRLRNRSVSVYLFYLFYVFIQ